MGDRPLVFLSHSSTDTAAVLALAHRIEAAPEAQAAGLKVWLDRSDLGAGARPWMEQLEEALRRSTAFAVYVGNTGVRKWVGTEVRTALIRAHDDPSYPIVPILTEHASVQDLPEFLQQYQTVSNVEDDADQFKALLRAVLRLEPRAGVAMEKEPFLGLKSFSPDHAHLFFGRDTEIREFLDLVRDETLVTVLGDSGSGKSSLVRAGLLPYFRRGLFGRADPLADDTFVWHAVEMRPQGDPFERLAEAVSQAAHQFDFSSNRLEGITDNIRSKEALKVRDGVRYGAPDKARILIYVDQFEELFTLAPARDRRPFIETLLALGQPDTDLIRVVLSMRRDYFNLLWGDAGRPLYDRLRARNWRARYRLRRMEWTRMRACIVEPLKLAGRDEDEAANLADAVLKDAGDHAGDLALVEMALTKTWADRHQYGDNLLLSYERNNRVEGALASAGDEVFEMRLTDEERSLAEELFIRLVRLGETGGTTRRIAHRMEFSSETWALAQKLATPECYRLLVVSGEGQGTVEIIHEALVTQWPLYQRWLQGDEADPRAPYKRTLDRLIDAAARWRAAKRHAEFLVRGADLRSFCILKRDHPQWLSAHEHAFVNASNRFLTYSRYRQRLGWLSLVAVFYFIMMFILIQSVAFGVAFAPRGDRLLTGGPDGLSCLWDAETGKAIQAFKGHGSTLFDRPVRSVAFSPNGTRVLTGGADGTARLWNVETGKETRIFKGHGSTLFDRPVRSVAFSPDGTHALTGSADGTARLWDATTGAEIRAFKGHSGPVWSAAFSPDGTRVLTGSRGTARLWDAETGNEIQAFKGHGSWFLDRSVRSVAFSPDGARVLTGGMDDTARLWDAATGAEISVFRGHSGSVSSVAYSPNGTRVLTGSHDGTARLWETETGKEIQAFKGHGRWFLDRAVRSVAFSPEGARVLTGGVDGTARLWDTETGKEIRVFGDHRSKIGILFAINDLQVLTGSEQCTERLEGFKTAK